MISQGGVSDYASLVLAVLDSALGDLRPSAPPPRPVASASASAAAAAVAAATRLVSLFPLTSVPPAQ